MGKLGARPAQAAELAREAQGTGVRLIVCNTALQHTGIPRDQLDPGPDQIVPRGVVKLAELVSLGHQVIRV
ncbi:MAG TPA: DsrE family protein [Gemmatimonadales bacterium]|nr:DsrE family protein [Gemmatimonadales bacterium]